MDVTIGQLLDKKYRIVRLLGEGGMGAVYEGENIRVHNRVAIKVLHAGIATNQAVVDRFEREAQAAGRIGSEHIVEVYDLGDMADGARYMVMEYLDGESLSQRVTNVGRMDPVALGTVMLQLLEGLGAAHKAGIIHRDLKPDNVFLMKAKNGSDFVKIVDFGVSKFNALSGDSQMSMTRTGAVIGTPYYMSPEQARGAKETDHRSDLYSAGVVMFECVTGQVPFLADTFNELMFKIVLEPPPDPEKLVPGLDPAFAAIIKKGMAREPAARYQTAAEFSHAIAQWLGMAAPTSALASTTTPRYGSMPEIAAAAPVSDRGVPSNQGVPVHAMTPAPTDQLGGTANPLASSTMKPAQSGSKAGMLLGAAAVLLVGLGGLGFAMFKTKDPSTGAASPGSGSSTVVDTKPTTTASIAPTVTTPPVEPTPPASAAATAPDAGPTETANTNDTKGSTKPTERKPSTNTATNTSTRPPKQPGTATTETKPPATKTGKGELNGRGFDTSL